MNTITTVLGESGFYDCNRLDQEEIVEREIVIADTPVRFRIGIANESLRLSDIVPLARIICDTLSDVVLHFPENKTSRISCRKGCAACCSYLVPLSMPEVFRLQGEFSLMPEGDRVTLLESCIRAARQILNRDITESEINESSDLKQLSDWYAGLHIQCPFLSHGICRIYQQRPLACREHFVTSHPDRCKSGNTHNPHVVSLPIRLAEVLGEFAAKLERSETESIMLPLALIGTDEIAERSGQTWDAVSMVNLFLDLLEQTAAKNSETLAVPL